jgi:hypothetical protein
VHPSTVLSGAEALNPGVVGLERCLPVPELVEFNNLLAAVWLQKLKYEADESGHRINGLGQ